MRLFFAVSASALIASVAVGSAIGCPPGPMDQTTQLIGGNTRNGDFESGELTPWIAAPEASGAVVADDSVFTTGLYAARLTWGGELTGYYATISQTIEVSRTDGDVFVAEWTAWCSSGEQLAVTLEAEYHDPGTDTWSERLLIVQRNLSPSFVHTLPEARFSLGGVVNPPPAYLSFDQAKVRLSFRYPNEYRVEGYIDDVSFSQVKPSCRLDVNGDGRANVLDMIRIRNAINLDPQTEGRWCLDVKQDGRINILDLIYFRDHMMDSCSN